MPVTVMMCVMETYNDGSYV